MYFYLSTTGEKKSDLLKLLEKSDLTVTYRMGIFKGQLWLREPSLLCFPCQPVANVDREKLLQQVTQSLECSLSPTGEADLLSQPQEPKEKNIPGLDEPLCSLHHPFLCLSAGCRFWVFVLILGLVAGCVHTKIYHWETLLWFHLLLGWKATQSWFHNF